MLNNAILAFHKVVGEIEMTQKETFKQQVVSLGRITIPAINRELLGLKVGDYVKVTIEKAEGA